MAQMASVVEMFHGSFGSWLNFGQVENSFKQVELKCRFPKKKAMILTFVKPQCFVHAIQSSKSAITNRESNYNKGMTMDVIIEINNEETRKGLSWTPKTGKQTTLPSCVIRAYWTSVKRVGHVDLTGPNSRHICQDCPPTHTSW